MSRNNDYKKGRVVDATTLLPEHIRTDILEGISDNIFNRFFTKRDFENVNGFVGEDSEDAVVNKLPEDREFLEKNQLQPVLKKDIGNESEFLTFEQFMRILENEGIDVDKFNEWGKTLQFNFYPPIDIDKIINFQDYYWTDQKTTPDYITIKNEKVNSKGRLEKLLQSVFGMVQNPTITSSIYTIINNEDDGLFVVIDTNKNTRTLVRKSGLTLVELENGTEPEFSNTFEYIKLDYSLNSITPNSVTISGPNLQNIPSGYIVSLYSTENDVQEFFTVENVFWEPETNLLTITFTEPLNNFNYSKLSLHPTITTEFQKYLALKNPSKTVLPEEIDVFTIGKTIWTNKNEIISGTGETTLGSSTITINGINLNTLLIPNIDYKINIKTGPNSGTYDISSYTNNSVTLNNSINFFTDTDQEFTIFKDSTLEKNETPEENDVWFDLVNDILKQYIQGEWVNKGLSFSTLLNSTEKVSNIHTNDWQKSNSWAHKNQLSTLSLSRQAAMPIIEYESYLELSEFSNFTYDWEYSPAVDASHIKVEQDPNLFEISNIELDSDNVLEYVGPNTFRLPEKYGNMEPHIKPGDIIVFSGFSNNTGTYAVDEVKFIQPAPNKRYVTEIRVLSSFLNLSDSPVGALIHPRLTSKGDIYDPNHDHWIFNGVKNITPSSVDKEINPMLLGKTNSYTAINSVGEEFESIVGLNFQEFNPTNEYAGLRIEFDPTLHNICLFEDFQEGDLRLYINGERIFDRFNEGSVNGKYTTHIILDNDIVVGPSDRIRVELGEYFKEDVGKKDVDVLTDYGIDAYNISDDRRVEQKKTKTNQYPQFKLYDIFGNALQKSNPIFWFKESNDAIINNYVFRRLETKRNASDFVFEHGLMENNGRLLCYKDLTDGIVKSIWRRGRNNEQYVPQKIGPDWDMPNPWFYNIEHDLKKETSLVDIFRHYRTIELAQSDPMLIGEPQNIYHALEYPNEGIGGTIKEHNENWDLLISTLTSGNVSINDVIEFAGKQYRNILFSVMNRIMDTLPQILEENITSDNILSYINNDFRLDRIFGDSSSFFAGVGIKNVIATSSVIRLTNFYEPQLYKVRDNWAILHHDGHRSIIKPKLEEKLVAFRALTDTQQKITSLDDPFPDSSNFSDGDFLIRGNSVKQTVDLYSLEDSSWKFVDLEKIIGDYIIEIETKLYEVSKKIAETVDRQYDIDSVIELDNFSELERKEFLNYFCNNNALENDIFDSADAFTWNYTLTLIENNPIIGQGPTESRGSWQAIYEKLFNTPYPHMEPWRMQGYKNKPDWWDEKYINLDDSSVAKWDRSMWDNILSGIIPSGETLPNGTTSTGASNEAAYAYSHVPINITNDNIAGVLPDQIIPPYWDGSLSSDPRFKPIFDKSEQEFIKTPNASFLFGQNGHNEWEWRNSIDYIYARIKIAYKLDPLKFFNKAYGNQFQYVDCLLVDKKTEKVLSHKNTTFHGEIREGSPYISHGLQQWLVHYNRFNEKDGASSLYRNIWKNWEPRLSYLFNTFINDTTLRVQGDTIDITDKDFSVDILKDTTKISNLFASIKASIRKIPSRFSDSIYDSKNWVFELESQTPKKVKTLETFHPQNYEFRQLSDSEFGISSYKIEDASISNTRGFWRATYSDPLSLDTISNLTSTYQATIEVDGQTSTTVTIVGNAQTPPTINKILQSLNEQLSGASASIESGSIIIESDNTNVDTSTSSINVSSDTLFTNIQTGFFSDTGTTSLEFDNIFFLKGNQTRYFKIGDTIEIINSENFNGEFTIESVAFSRDDAKTIIRVEEDRGLSSETVDGVIIPQNAITLPWDTGQEVYLDTDGTLPGALDKEKPYYLIKIDDFTFKLANTQANAIDNKELINLSTGAGCFWVGNLARTFKPLGGDPDIPFRHYEPDTRKIHEYTGNITISRLQNLVDFILGYNDYLEYTGILSENERQDNVDEETGRGNSWQVELEKYLSWANKLLLTSINATPSIKVEVDRNSNAFKPQTNIIFGTGDKVSINDVAGENGTVPDELNFPFNSFIPYYIIITNSGNIQLAFTERDALNGKNIPFNTGNGIIEISVFRKNKKFPNRILNPYKIQFSVEHENGLLESFVETNNSNVFQNNSLYDSELKHLDLEDVLLYRKDTKSKIALTENTNKVIAGGSTSLIDVSHICNFDPYSTGDKLIYDSFLGIATPRIFLEFIKPTEKTGRPSVGGLVLNNNSLIDSIEKSIEDIRYYYDPYKSIETDKTSIEAKKSVGYQGPNQFMFDLGIDEKSQFIFWKSFIQNKGTNKSLTAFTGHRLLENVNIDEYWAYRLCEFGDSERKSYPEIKLKTDDVIKRELRLEFAPPTGGVIIRNAIPIRLNDVERWNNLPDVIRLMNPHNGYFFDAKEQEIILNAENLAELTQFQRGTGNKSIKLNKPAYGAIVTYTIDGTEKNASEGISFRFINSRILEFIDEDFDDWENIKVVTLTYAYEEENPLRLIETKKPEKVLKEIPIWNPALDQHNPLGEFPIDIDRPDDPAKYTNDLNESRVKKNYWHSKETGTIWLDTSRQFYKPYFDEDIFLTEDERSLVWGQLEEFGDVKLYKWIQTTLSPTEYIEQAEEDENRRIELSEKVTGNPRRIVYKNIGTTEEPIWQEETITVSKFPVAGYDNTNDTSMFSSGDSLNVYVNGEFLRSIEYDNASALEVMIDNDITSGDIQQKDMLTLVREPHEPTQEELENEEYVIIYPHTKVKSFNTNSLEEEYIYFYWVSDMRSEKLLQNTSLTLFDAERAYKSMSEPFAIIHGFRNEGTGYGVLFGSTYDPEDNTLPTRFSACTIKGLNRTVKDDNNYILRLTKDYTLRDRLNKKDLKLSNKHWSWKLTRRKQSGKIDLLLWKKVIEAATEKTVINNDFDLDTESSLPSESRIRFDTLIEGATSRIGLYNGRVLMDKPEIMKLTMEVLLDPSRQWERVDIEEFIDSFDLDRIEGIRDFYKSIYEIFSAVEVNDIFFELLERSVSLNQKHPDIFKTSWVSVDVSNRVELNTPTLEDIIQVFPSEIDCGEILPSPTPSVSVTPTPTPSVSTSVTPTPTPSISISVTPTPTPSVSISVTPTPSPTQSSGFTPTPTPSQGSGFTPTPTPSVISLSSISPTSGDEAGGTDVTITGENFDTGRSATVRFDNVLATNITIVSDTEITCTTPAGTGIVDVVVTQNGIADTLVGAFEFTTSESVTPTPSVSESATPTPTPTISDSVTPTPTPSVSESVTPTPTPSISESATPIPTPSTSDSATPTPTPSVSDSTTPTPTPTPTPSVSESVTPTPTPSVSESATPTPTPSISDSVTPTPTPSVSESVTPTPTPSISESATPTPTPSVSESATPTPTPSISESATPTPTPSVSESVTPTPTPSISESATPTPTPTPTPSNLNDVSTIFITWEN